MGRENNAPSLCPGVIKVEERPLFDKLKLMYSKRTTEGERVRYEYDKDRFSDLDRIEALCALDSRVAEYRTYVRTRIGSYDTISMLDTGNSFADVINADMKKALGIKSSDLRPYRGRSSIGTAKVAARMRIEGETKEEYEIYLSPSLRSEPVSSSFPSSACRAIYLEGRWSRMEYRSWSVGMRITKGKKFL